MTAIDKIAPYRSKRIKGNTQKQFNSKFSEKLNAKEKLFKILKRYRLNIDKKLYKKAKCEVSKLITTKKQAFFEKKLSEAIDKRKELWESLKSLLMLNKTVISNLNAIGEGNTLTHDS